MRIKRLEIHGFKSFSDRMVLNFGQGITGVVGPNGCGKSNVVDAIRWCMGEMSAKHLRGRAMQDVIFSGSDSRGPSGMAEVTLTFDNDGDVPPQYAQFSEIAVTRRLFRDGSSEYLINKISARLRDITDLFLGTGVGTRAYSIIEQGRIGFVVNSRPEERRSLIEEVAGITKFKTRKKAAERRLEATEQNLLRVNDIISELERQLGSLRRQARKAERYKEIKSQLRELELHAASLEYLRIQALEKVHVNQEQALSARLEDAQGSLAVDESSIEADRLRLLEEESALQSKQQASAEVDAQLAALERDLEHWRNQLTEARTRVESATLDLDESRTRAAQVETEQAELAEASQDWEGHAQRDAEALELLSSQVAEAQQELAQLDTELEEVRSQALEHMHIHVQQRSRLESLEKSRHDVTQRLERASEDQLQLQERRAETEATLSTLESRQAELVKDIATWSEKMQSLRQDLERVLKEVAEGESCIQNLKDEHAERRSRLASLEEIAKRMEGYSDGVRTLMQGGEGEQGGRPAVQGIKALVTDILESPPEYELALEAALGERLQYMVVDGHAAALQAVALLKQSDGGRSGFIPEDVMPAGADASLDNLPFVVGPALDLVTVRPGFDVVAKALLGHVWVVNNIEAALEQWHAGNVPASLVLVTPEGEILSGSGMLCGGAAEGTGLLTKRREIRELGERVAELEAALAHARQAHEQVSVTRLQLEVDIQQLEKDLRAAELEKLSVDKDLEAQRREAQGLLERLEVLAYEVQQRQDELAAMDAEERTSKEAMEQAAEAQAAAEADMAGLQERRQLHATHLDARTAELTELKVRKASQQEKLASSQATLRRLQDTAAELLRRMERQQQTIEDSQQAILDLEERVRTGGAQAVEISALAQQRRQELQDERQRYEQERAAMGDVEQSLKNKRQIISTLQQEITEAKMALQRLDMDRRHLLEQIAERHDVHLPTVLTDFHLLPPPSEESQKLRQDLERSLKNIGPINLTAIDECEEVERRYAFLSKQREDLVGALESLRRAIQRINRASRERFRDAFESVNQMFQQVFPRLFRGGEARLLLTDSEDVLEAGVDIVAMPPGKKPQSVSLLSGGEKALTATALIFSIFLIKPSPFCILDEVDAPLDDANVGRFNQMLREISAFSQFIVITHDKQTMQQADRLYGITMEEPGMSKVVSVDLGDRQEQAA